MYNSPKGDKIGIGSVSAVMFLFYKQTANLALMKQCVYIAFLFFKAFSEYFLKFLVTHFSLDG